VARLTIVVEWPKGSQRRYEWRGQGFVEKLEDLPAPVNYGFVPGTYNPADGAETDAVLLGPPVPARARYQGELVGAVLLKDGDHKLVLSPDGRPPSEEEVEALLTWFEPERGARFVDAEEAWALLKDLF